MAQPFEACEARLTLAEQRGGGGERGRAGGGAEQHLELADVVTHLTQLAHRRRQPMQHAAAAQPAEQAEAAVDHAALHAAEVSSSRAAEDGGEHEIGLELLHLRHAVHEGAVRAHHARRELAVDRVEHHLRLSCLWRR